MFWAFSTPSVSDGKGGGRGAELNAGGALSLFFVSLPVQNSPVFFLRPRMRPGMHHTDIQSLPVIPWLMFPQQNLARANLADVDPHPFVNSVLYTH